MKDATTDVAAVVRTWGRWSAANIGLRTGAAPDGAGVIAIDIDPRHGGEDSLAELISENGELPPSVEALTGSGGRHLLYDHPGRKIHNRTGVRSGIDVRGDGGYIVVAPSLHISGDRYRWVPGHSPWEIELAPVPPWLLDLIVPPKVAAPAANADGNPRDSQETDGSRDDLPLLIEAAQRYLARVTGAGEGARNSAAFSLAGHLVAFVVEGSGLKLTEPQVFDLLRPWNYLNTPPLDEEELRGAVQNASRNGEPRKPHPVKRPAAGEPIEAECPAPQVEPFRPFPVDVFPAAMRRLVEDGARAIGCDPSFLALPALSVLASCIGNAVRIRLKRSWSEPAIIWGVVVARSGTIKSAPFRLVMAPIYDAQREASTEYEEARAKFEVEEMRHEGAVRDWKKTARTRKGDLPIAPKPPVFRRCVTADATAQALAPMLRDNPRGVLVACPELSSLIAGFGQFTGKRMADAAAWLPLWDADALIVDRKTGDQRTIIVRKASASVTGTVQPGTLERVFESDLREAGTLARFLLAAPPSKPELWRDDDLSDRVKAGWASIVDTLAAIPLDLDLHGDPVPRMIDLDEDARAAFIEWHNAHAGETADAEGDLAAALSKIKGYAARFALVLHLAGSATGEPKRDQISRPTMLAAIRLAEWFKGEARRVYGWFGESDEDRDRRRLAGWIERRDGMATPRDLTHTLQAFRGKADEAEAALRDLAKAGYGSWEIPSPGPGGGHPSSGRFTLYAADTNTNTPNGAVVMRGCGGGVTPTTLETHATPGRRRVRI